MAHYCKNCGVRLDDTARFCPKCGTKVESGGGAVKEEATEPKEAAGEAVREETPEPKEVAGEAAMKEFSQSNDPYEGRGDSQGGTGRKQRKGGKILIAAAALLLAVGAVGGGICYKKLSDTKKQLAQLEQLLQGEDTVEAWARQEKKKLDEFGLNEDEEKRLEELLEEGEELEEKDYAGQIPYVQSVQDLETEVRTRLDGELGALLEELKSTDPGYASDQEKEALSEYAVKMEGLIAEGKYKKAGSVAEEWRQYAQAASVKKTGYTVSVTQHDFTEYPTVRLYLDVRDTAGGVVKELSSNMFYVSERDAATGDFLNRQVQKAVLLNENERLNINLLADTSGSMEGGNMEAAKQVMSHFLSTVQFSAGDMVKLTPFNSIIDKSGFFSGDLAGLNQTIQGYYPSGQTKLYDSIIYGVQDVSGQEGARCVIAFTDGMDVGSYNSAQDVVNVVSRYHIPVFIVRIGDSSTSAEDDSLRWIAEASGGSFKNLSQFNQDMSDFYSQIYRQMKEYYVVEYMAENMAGVMEDKEISVYIQNDQLGGEVIETVNPGSELFDSLLGSYLRSYIVDMNNHRYEQLEKYVDNTTAADDKWSIQWQMKKQVTGGFSNVVSETLMDYQVTDVTVVDENTIRIKANENYDVYYEELYGDLKNSQRTVAMDALAMLNIPEESMFDDTTISIWARVNQIPEYILKKGADGQWKFSQYAGDLALGERRKVYDVDILDY